MRIKSIHIFVLILVSACADSKGLKYPTTESKVLNEFIRTASIQSINLDSVETTQIVLDEDNIILDLKRNDSEPIISDIRYFVNTPDMYYVYSWLKREIYQIDKEGINYGSSTRAGRGPGEHGILSDLTRNSKQIFITDETNARIDIFNYDFEHQNTISEVLVSDIAVSENLLLTTRFSNHGLNDSGLVKVSSLSDPKKAIKYIMPKIVPDGYQPFIYNMIHLALNKHNQVAASYSPLPWIFLFDKKLELRHTLIFEDSRFDSLNRAPLHIYKPSNEEGVEGKNLLQRFTITDNGDLFILNNVIEHLVKNEDGSYEHVGRYKIIYPETDQTFWVDQLIPLKDGKFVASNWYYLFEFELPSKY